ncbi:MAG: SIR2 family protein [Dehalococcoidia bacterium]
MHDFLDMARDLSARHGTNSAAFQTVFKGIGRLTHAHSKARLDVHNLEAVFAAFEMAGTLGRLGEYSRDEIRALVAALRDVIQVTLDESIQLPVRDRSVLAPPPYPDFVKLISEMEDSRTSRNTTSIITFNYDMAVDYALHNAGRAVDYALEAQERPGGLPLLKLHGSLNWALCASCRRVVPYTMQRYFSRYSWLDLEGAKQVRVSVGQHIKEFKHCDVLPEVAPVLVPPTWNKTAFHEDLGAVWRRAAEELSHAEAIYVIGYSLPSSDAFFRYLYALGTVGDSMLRRIWVFNPDRSEEIEARYRAMLGPAAEERFRYVPVEFKDAVGHIRAQPFA